ncbi:hypothetical protein V1511DRAFT_456354 [Dipodascopsis uninucleata]
MSSSLLSAIVVDIAAIEKAMSVAGTAVAVLTTISNLYKSQHERYARAPKQKELDMTNAKAYYFVKSMDMIRVPTNLERLPSARITEEQLMPAPVEPVNEVPGQSAITQDQSPSIWGTQHMNKLRRGSRDSFFSSFSIRKLLMSLRPRFRRRRQVKVQKVQPKRKLSTPKRDDARQWWQREHVVNVLSSDDAILYTIERYKHHVYMIYSYPERVLIATIRLQTNVRTWGPNARGHTIEFHTGQHAKDIGRRKLRRKTTHFDHYNVFYTDDGAPYHWARRSRRLERVVNYGGKELELRHVVAQAKPLRRKGLDYELIVDENRMDPLMAICTAYISIKTQWIQSDAPLVQNRTQLQQH